MPEIMFACPKCKQSLEGDDSMRGQVVDCPSCNAQITIPSVPQKKQIILPKSAASGGAPAHTTPPKQKSSKVGIVIALVIGLAIGYCAGSAKGPSGIGKSIGGGGGISLSTFGRPTKEAWMKKLAQQEFYHDIARQIAGVEKDAFIRIMGKPDKTQVVGDQLIWYYDCSDGQIQLVLHRGIMDIEDTISTEMINEY